MDEEKETLEEIEIQEEIPKKKKRKSNSKNKTKNFIIKEILPIVVIVLVIFFIRDYLVTPVLVNGSSMDPTLHDGDVMILNKIGYKCGGLDRFDIVVIKTDSTMLIKRIIGLPNENIKVIDNELYINDEIF